MNIKFIIMFTSDGIGLYKKLKMLKNQKYNIQCKYSLVLLDNI